QILDIVPNHMGVMGSDNAWWLDVLENGPAAVSAPFFDIDWQPFKEELRNKVLLPTLGDHYGIVLSKGELKVMFDAQAGAFSVQYYDHRFPIDPREYPVLLSDRIDQLATRLGTDNPLFLEYQSLLTGFGHLPARTALTPEAIAERARDKEIHKRHLVDLCARSPDIALFITENVQRFNGKPGDADSFDALHALLEAQAYRLSFWRVAADDINYRRFFDINDLAGLRMENETVFQQTHRLIFKLLAEGRLNGLRIDHPDGLYNPKQYFQRLQEALVSAKNGTAVKNGAPSETDAKPIYVVVEKILESYERLPEDWPVHGTTGYDFANLVNALLIDGEAEERLTQTYANFIETEIDFAELLYWCKRLIMNTALASELNVLATQLSRIAEADRNTRDFTLHGLHGALKEVVAWFPVYRTYVTPAGVSEEDKRYVNWAISVAKKRSQATDIGIFDFLYNVLLTLETEGKPAAFREQVIAFAMKFQQYTGPLMAKGLEDTVFYRYNRLVSLNEVGGDPTRFSVSVNGFHHANQERARLWPHSLLATSTHDSKRSEDVRARLNVLSEVPEAWEKRLQRWSRLNQNERRSVDNKPAPSRNDEYLLYQTLLGAWPLEELDEAGLEAFRQRIENYMLKAVKEAKVHSSWVNPNPEYEGAIVAFIQALLKPGKNRFLEDFLPDQRRIARLGLFNSLSQTLIKLTAPGVPDIYQGTELWDFSLVDPDNRRPVDYERRRALLMELQTLVETAGDDLAGRVRGLLDRLEDGRSKLYVNWRTLRLRREQSELFGHGDYVPLAVAGAKSRHVCAFARVYENTRVVVVAPRL
ncbi:MAG TPA: malto-oligosyltrehalose synthase, partial [Candidatus Competibacteraceae bacterium]|nr:malto-oligosyltrehalose synthase [Candidatus Competibacteraceae bacterium]